MVSAAIITNTNQSAVFIRMLARNASMDIDAVYYNPAGLTQLKNGFHVAIYNQTISQEKKTEEVEQPILPRGCLLLRSPLLSCHSF